jgi:hypothetical protein
LYEESQGIIDVVVKLFMLGQARAMELGSARKKRPEKIDAALLRIVAKDHFKIIAPMIAALKSGKRSRIAQYDDLRPLDDHVYEALQAAQIHLQSQHSPAQAQSSDTTPVAMSTEALVTQLKELGLSEDIAWPIATTALAEHPAASLLELIGLISSKLFERAPGARPLPRSHRARAQSKSKAMSELEKTVAVDQQAGKSAHDSLREAGLISQPELEIED